MPTELVSARIRQKLSALRRLLRAHLVARGAAWLIVAAVAAVFVTLGVDLALKLDRAQRGLFAALALAGLVYVSWRFILRPLRVPMNSQELALVLERHFPRLDDRLISTVQFAQAPAVASGESVSMIERIARQADELVGPLSAAAVVEKRGTWRRLGAASGATLVLAVFTVLNLPLMGLWFQRNVLLADVDWPRQTVLRVEGGPNFRVPRGGKLVVTVTAAADKVVPEDVTFHLKFPGLGVVPETVRAAEPGGHTFVKTFDNVAEAFEFHVTGNDDRTPACRVETVDPPELTGAAFTIIEPEYTNAAREGRSVSAAHGVLAAPAGSTVVLTGLANKDLTSVRLLLDGRAVGSPGVTKAAPAEASQEQRPRGIRGDFHLPERPGKVSLTLQVELTDTEQITNPRGAVYVVRIEPDRAPSVTASRFAVRGDITTKALIPLIVEVKDDHGVAGVSLSVQPTTRPAKAEVTAIRDIPTGQREIRLQPQAQPGRLTYDGLDIRKYNFGLGEIIRVVAIARDTLPESFGGPNVAESAVQTFRIVSDEEIIEELIRRQKEISQDFVRAVAQQAQVRDRLRGLKDRLEKLPAVDAECKRLMASAGADQRLAAGQCGQCAQQLQAVLDEMFYNRVAGPAEQTRLRDRIIAPLAELSKKPMPDAAAAMDRASNETDAAGMRQSAGDWADVADGFYQRLEAILKEMREMENRQELINQLKRIIDWSEELRKRMGSQAKGQTGSIFETPTQPSP